MSQPYVTDDEAKTFCQVTGTAEDDWFAAIVDEASDAFDVWAGRTFRSATRTEYYSGTGRPELLLRQRPVSTSGLDVRLDNNGYFGQAAGTFGTDSALVAGVHYALKLDDPDDPTMSQSGILIWLNYPANFATAPNWPVWVTPGVLTPGVVRAGWPASDGNIRVSYTAGYTTIPPAIRLAIKGLIQDIRNDVKAGDFVPDSTALGPLRIGKAQLQRKADAFFSAQRALSRFREVVI